MNDPRCFQLPWQEVRVSRAKEAPQEDWALLYYTVHTACIFSSGTWVPVWGPSVVPICVTVHLSCANIVGSSIFNYFLLLQIPSPVCCKAQQEIHVWRKAGRWQEDALVLRPNSTFSGKHITTIFLRIMWISGMWLGQTEASCPCYKQSPTYPWSRCTWHCATLRA